MTTPTKFENTHISLVLDRSGSMNSCRDETLSAVNGYLDSARKDDALKESDFELTLFDSQGIDTIRSGAPCNLPDLTLDEFVPRSMTPLFDAIGRGIESLDARLAKSGDKKAILVVVTDGFENSSKKHSLSSIQELIAAKQKAGWLVIFLGAGLEAAQQGLAMGFRAATVANIGLSRSNLSASGQSLYGMNRSYANTQSFDEAQAVASSASFSDEERAAMGDNKLGEGLLAKTVKTAKTPDEPKQDHWDKLPSP